jgi:hypothetical protein
MNRVSRPPSPHHLHTRIQDSSSIDESDEPKSGTESDGYYSEEDPIGMFLCLMVIYETHVS